MPKLELKLVNGQCGLYDKDRLVSRMRYLDCRPDEQEIFMPAVRDYLDPKYRFIDQFVVGGFGPTVDMLYFSNFGEFPQGNLKSAAKEALILPGATALHLFNVGVAIGTNIISTFKTAWMGAGDEATEARCAVVAMGLGLVAGGLSIANSAFAPEAIPAGSGSVVGADGARVISMGAYRAGLQSGGGVYRYTGPGGVVREIGVLSGRHSSGGAALAADLEAPELAAPAGMGMAASEPVVAAVESQLILPNLGGALVPSLVLSGTMGVGLASEKDRAVEPRDMKEVPPPQELRSWWNFQEQRMKTPLEVAIEEMWERFWQDRPGIPPLVTIAAAGGTRGSTPQAVNGQGAGDKRELDEIEEKIGQLTRQFNEGTPRKSELVFEIGRLFLKKEELTRDTSDAEGARKCFVKAYEIAQGEENVKMMGRAKFYEGAALARSPNPQSRQEAIEIWKKVIELCLWTLKDVKGAATVELQIARSSYEWAEAAKATGGDPRPLYRAASQASQKAASRFEAVSNWNSATSAALLWVDSLLAEGRILEAEGVCNKALGYAEKIPADEDGSTARREEQTAEVRKRIVEAAAARLELEGKSDEAFDKGLSLKGKRDIASLKECVNHLRRALHLSIRYERSLPAEDRGEYAHILEMRVNAYLEACLRWAGAVLELTAETSDPMLDEAYRVIKEAHEALEGGRIRTQNVELRVKITRWLGDFYASSGKFAEASGFYATAYELAQQNNLDQQLVNRLFIKLGMTWLKMAALGFFAEGPARAPQVLGIDHIANIRELWRGANAIECIVLLEALKGLVAAVNGDIETARRNLETAYHNCNRFKVNKDLSELIRQAYVQISRYWRE